MRARIVRGCTVSFARHALAERVHEALELLFVLEPAAEALRDGVGQLMPVGECTEEGLGFRFGISCLSRLTDLSQPAQALDCSIDGCWGLNEPFCIRVMLDLRLADAVGVHGVDGLSDGVGHLVVLWVRGCGFIYLLLLYLAPTFFLDILAVSVRTLELLLGAEDLFRLDLQCYR
jgi:hypothetical protein